MAKGHEVFVKERLTEAREARGINQTQLSELIDVTRQAISQYESGDRTPTFDILNRIAQALRFPVHRFTKPIDDRKQDSVFFRSYASATKIARSRARRQLEWVIFDICDFLSQYVELPPANLPVVTSLDDPNDITPEVIEAAATNVRRFWGLGDGPISDLTLLLENNGIVVVYQELGANTLDAFSCWNTDRNRPFIVLGTDKGSAVRARMNAAHELAHLVLHRHLRPGLIARKDTHGLLEYQAKHFAGAFLLPKSTFFAEIRRPNLNSFATIKGRWRVAIQAMIVRAKELGAISELEQERLFVYLSQRGWRKNEPLDNELPFEKTRLIERALSLVLENNLVTQLGIEAETALFVSDIERALGLQVGYFDANDSGKFAGLRIVKPFRDSSTAS